MKLQHFICALTLSVALTSCGSDSKKDKSPSQLPEQKTSTAEVPTFEFPMNPPADVTVAAEPKNTDIADATNDLISEAREAKAAPGKPEDSAEIAEIRSAGLKKLQAMKDEYISEMLKGAEGALPEGVDPKSDDIVQTMVKVVDDTFAAFETEVQNFLPKNETEMETFVSEQAKKFSGSANKALTERTDQMLQDLIKDLEADTK